MEIKRVIEFSPEVSMVSNDFDQLLKRFLSSFDCAEITREVYARRLRHFSIWLIEQKCSQPDRDTINRYKRHLRDSKFQANSISGYLSSVKSFFTWLESVRVYPNVAKGVKAYKRPRGFRKDALTIKQVKTLLSATNGENLLEKRDLALINLMICTGLRTIEVIRADAGDMRSVSTDSIGIWVQGKGATEKDSFVVLTESVVTPIQDYLAARGHVRQDEPLFASLSDGNFGCRLSTRTIRRIVKKRLRGIRLESPRLSAHSLRHTAVTLALQGGASLQEVQSMARHSDISTTLIYAHTIDKAKGIAEKSIESLLRSDTVGY